MGERKGEWKREDGTSGILYYLFHALPYDISPSSGRRRHADSARRMATLTRSREKVGGGREKEREGRGGKKRGKGFLLYLNIPFIVRPETCRSIRLGVGRFPHHFLSSARRARTKWRERRSNREKKGKKKELLVPSPGRHSPLPRKPGAVPRTIRRRTWNRFHARNRQRRKEKKKGEK